MCICISNYRNQIGKKTLKKCWNNNSDGAGMIYINSSNKIEIFKELDNFENFYKMYSFIRNKSKKPIILHFRISTHGKVNLDNCHPFTVNEDLAFVHNGIIDIDTCLNFSDTYHFNEMLKGLPKDFLNNDSILSLISGFIGDYNKLIFMDSEGIVSIIHEEYGIWDSGNWYSNTTYKDNYRDFGGKRVEYSSKDDFYKEDDLNDFPDKKYYSYWEELEKEEEDRLVRIMREHEEY